MKILKIELQNINSLKCDVPVVIDFEQTRFEDVGLFAITGPTGAGKTTLLDAITIALYRRVPRLEKSTSKSGLEDIVSYGASSAMARITFQAQKKRYEAQWDIRLTSNNGKRLANPVETVRLKNLTDEVIVAETKTGCDEKIIEIAQLTYEQFLRSVMLAQGEFAAFLSAKNAEKGYLLQQIAGDDIYKKIGQTLRLRISEEEKVLNQIKSKINTDDLLGDELATQLKVEDAQLNTSIAALTTELKKVDAIIKWYDEVNKLQQQKASIEATKLQLEADVVQHATVLQQLENHEAAEPFKANLLEIIRLELEIEQRKNRITVVETALVETEHKLAAAIVTEAGCKVNVLEAEKLSFDMQPTLEQVITYDATIKSHTTALAETNKAKEALVEANKLLTTSINSKSDELIAHATTIKQLAAYIEQHPHTPVVEKKRSHWNTQLTQRKSNWERLTTLNTGITNSKAEVLKNKTLLNEITTRHAAEKATLDLLTSSIKSLQDSLDKSNSDQLLVQNNALTTKREQLRELKQWSTSHAQLIIDKNSLTEQIAALERQQKTLSKLISQLDNDIKTSVKSVKDAEELYEKDQYIVSLEDERQKLKEGEACALCGSTVHPLINSYAEITISDSKKRLEERKVALEELKSEQVAAGIKQAQIGTEWQQVELQSTKNEAALTELTVKFSAATSAYKIENLSMITRELQEIEVKQLALSQQLSEVREQQQLKERKQTELKAIEERIKVLELELTQLSTANLGLEKSILENVKEYDTLTISNDALERVLVSEFSDCELSLPETENTINFIQQLESHVTTYNNTLRYQTEINNIVEQCKLEIKNWNDQMITKINELSDLENKINNLNEELNTLKNSRELLLPLNVSTESKRTELQAAINLANNSMEEARKSLNNFNELQTAQSTEKASIGKELTENAVKLNTASKTLLDNIALSRFVDRQALTEAILPDDLKTQYLQIRKGIENRRIENITLEKRITTELQQLEKVVPSKESLDNVLLQQTQLNDQKDSLQKRAGEISESFRKDIEIKSRNTQVVSEINQQNEVCNKWIALMKVLGGSQDAFNTYVQRLTLNNLINLANLHLYELNKRYSLLLNPEYKSGEELNFKLVDHYQADETRLVDTSSGGEKFLISLALALGLSDLASYNVNIGSLFIDEGFGTLDSNTLETVISSLETLKAKGKMIGIISHVDSLRERIPVQIQVIKKSNGVSIVEIN